MADGGLSINDEVTFRLFILLFIYKLQQQIFFQDIGAQKWLLKEQYKIPMKLFANPAHSLVSQLLDTH